MGARLCATPFKGVHNQTDPLAREQVLRDEADTTGQ
jgi:hypothetical protein